MESFFTNDVSSKLAIVSTADLQSLIDAAAELKAQKILKEKLASTPEADSDEYITRKEALAILHIDSSTLNRWGHKKYLVGYKSGHQRLMYKKSEVIARSKGQEL